MASVWRRIKKGVNLYLHNFLFPETTKLRLNRALLQNWRFLLPEDGPVFANSVWNLKCYHLQMVSLRQKAPLLLSYMPLSGKGPLKFYGDVLFCILIPCTLSVFLVFLLKVATLSTLFTIKAQISMLDFRVVTPFSLQPWGRIQTFLRNSEIFIAVRTSNLTHYCRFIGDVYFTTAVLQWLINIQYSDLIAVLF